MWTSSPNIYSNFIWTLTFFLQNDDSGPVLKYCNLWQSKTINQLETTLSFVPFDLKAAFYHKIIFWAPLVV